MDQLSPEQFRDALRKGLGRAVRHVRHVPLETVRHDLAHACTHFLGLNLQEESGGRVPWLFGMIEATKDFDFYRREIVAAMEQMPDDPDDAETFNELFGLLTEFAKRGDAEVLEIMRQRFDSAILTDFGKPPKEKEEENLFKIWTCPELMQADLKQEFLIENVLVEGQPCIIGGPKKCLKTSIMLDMAVSLAAGVPFLRRFAVPVQKRVLVMSGESGLVTLRNTIARITDSIDLDPQEIDKLLICDRVPRLDNLSHIDILTKAMKDFQPGVVVFDPAYLMLTTDKPESLFATGGQLSAITMLCKMHGATAIIAHHNSKSSNVIGRTPDLDDLSWSGFAEFARQWILVSRNKAYDPMTGDQHIKMVVGGSYGHGGEYDIHVQEGVFPEEYRSAFLYTRHSLSSIEAKVWKAIQKYFPTRIILYDTKSCFSIRLYFSTRIYFVYK